MQNVCPSTGFIDEKAEMMHSWKIQVYSLTKNTHGVFGIDFGSFNADVSGGSFKLLYRQSTDPFGGLFLRAMPKQYTQYAPTSPQVQKTKKTQNRYNS